MASLKACLSFELGQIEYWRRQGGRVALVVGVAMIGALALADPVAAQPWAGGGAGGDSQLNTFASNFIPWFIRWMLVIGVLVAVSAHLYAGWTSNEDKAYRRREWRNRAILGVALAIPALIILNGIIVSFGGEPLDFIPFV